MKKKTPLNSNGSYLQFPNPLAGLNMHINYCTAHIRAGQSFVDEWGANLRRSHDVADAIELMTHSSQWTEMSCNYNYAVDRNRRDYFKKRYQEKKAARDANK